MSTFKTNYCNYHSGNISQGNLFTQKFYFCQSRNSNNILKRDRPNCQIRHILWWIAKSSISFKCISTQIVSNIVYPHHIWQTCPTQYSSTHFRVLNVDPPTLALAQATCTWLRSPASGAWCPGSAHVTGQATCAELRLPAPG